MPGDSFRDPAFYPILAPDGKTVVASGIVEKVIRCWDIATREKLRDIEYDDASSGPVQFSPDGNAFASFGSKSVHIWDFRTGKELLRLKDLPARMVGVRFSP